MASPSPSKEMEDYWNEFKTIQQGQPASDEDELSKTPDEGEIEAAWLDAAGYGFVVNKFQDGKDLSDGELDTLTHSLTRAQAKAVMRRIDTLSTTMRRKHQVKKPHVKDIFPRQADATQDALDCDVQIRPHPRPNHKRSDIGPFAYKRADVLPGNSSPSETGVEVLGFHPKPDNSQINNNEDQFPHLPSVSDIEISIDFHLEETEKSPITLYTIPDPHRIDLPAFEPKPDPLGVTYIGDLAACDMDKIRALAHIELTALFDHYGVIYSRPKRRKKVKDQGIFGVPLDTLVAEDQKRSPNTKIKIPLVFQAMIKFLAKEGLEAEGILRLSGSENRIKQLRQDLEEKFYAGLFSWGDASPHDVAAVMKQFLRELPVPVLSYEHLDAFPQVSNIPKTLEQLKALNLLILLLAEGHRDLLKFLLCFLREIVGHSHQNRMGLSNVGMIMAPNLFPPSSSKQSKEKLNLEMELKKASVTSNMVKMLIHYQDVLWTVPSTFIAQIRHQYTNEANRRSRERLVMRLPWKKDKDRSDIYKKPSPSPDQPEVQDGVIRVQAPHLTKSSALIQLDQFTTAADVVSKFKCDEGLLITDKSTIGEPEESDGHVYRNPNNAHYAHDTDFLFEVGGNISERCLDPKTQMLNLYHINPTAEWIIRKREGR